VSESGESGNIISLSAEARCEYRCRLEGGRGRFALRLDGRKLLDEELGEITFTLPPISVGQHALSLTIFRESLSVVGISELVADGEVRLRMAHDPEEEGFLSEHTLYLVLS
jgi:hypothetical protein